MRPIIIKYFYFWLSIYLLIFNFFWKNVLKCTVLPSAIFFSPLLGRRKGPGVASPSPNLGSPPSSHRWIFMGMTRIPGATVCLLKKKTGWEAAPASFRPFHFLLPPASFTWFGAAFWPLRWVSFCFPVSTVTLKGNEHKRRRFARSGGVVQALWHRRQAQPVIYSAFFS